MPEYIFQHPETQEIKEIVQRMNDVHEYTDEKGTKWNRIYTVPQGVVDGKMNAFSVKQFIDKTNKMKGGKIGDLWDLSKQLSDERAKATGDDPIRRKAFNEYSTQRLGKKHPEDKA